MVLIVADAVELPPSIGINRLAVAIGRKVNVSVVVQIFVERMVYLLTRV